MAHRRRQRDTSTPLNPSLGEIDSLLSDSLAPGPLLQPIDDLTPADPLGYDRRFFNPEGELASPSTLVGTPAPIVRQGDTPRVRNVLAAMERGTTPQSYGPHTSQQRFSVPHQVVECVRRKQRREVMFSLHKSKRRRGAGARRRRDEWSNIHC